MISNVFIENRFRVVFGSLCSTQREQVGLNVGMQYQPLLWPVWQSGAAVEHNNVILTLGLHTNGHITHTPIRHVSLAQPLGTLHYRQGPFCRNITWYDVQKD